jgi:membrane associated rhomboid family serine protease
VIPIGDSPRRRTTPWVTRAIILANLLVFAWVLTLSTELPEGAAARASVAEQTTGDCYGFATAPTEVDRFYCRWSFQPREFLDVAQDRAALPGVDRALVLVTILTSIFLHAGWLHILGNMLFLWVFGDNVEDRLGHIGFLLFYLAGGVIASLAQAWVDTNSLVPVVGASGAVAAVLGAYLIYFPKATVTTLLPIPIPIPFAVPAVLMIGIWFLQNLLAGVASVSSVDAPGGGIAFFAHIGGFVFGALAVLLFLRRVGERRRRRA